MANSTKSNLNNGIATSDNVVNTMSAIIILPCSAVRVGEKSIKVTTPKLSIQVLGAV
jgi:hypothetical protein